MSEFFFYVSIAVGMAAGMTCLMIAVVLFFGGFCDLRHESLTKRKVYREDQKEHDDE